MPLDTGFVQLNSINDYQSWLHDPKTISQKVAKPVLAEDPQGKLSIQEVELEEPVQEELQATFYTERIRVAWYTTFKDLMTAKTSDTNVDFTANMSAHFLLNSTLVLRIPEVHCRSENIKVAWTRNLLHNYVQSGELKFNDIPVQFFDSVGLDTLIQFKPGQTGPEKREQYFRNIGNRPHLTEFNRYLQATRLSLPLPWSFSERVDKAIPLCLARTTQVTMKFNLQKDPTKLLRVWEHKPDGPVYRSLKTDDLGTNVIVKSKGYELGNPEVRSEYGLITKSEVEWLQSQGPFEVYYDTLIGLDASDADTYSVQLNSVSPVRALFFMAQNLTSSASNNLSNYTNNPHDPYSGVSPISEVSLTYQQYKVYENEEAEVFSEDEPYWKTPACPSQPGFHAIVFSTNLDRDEDVGLVLTSLGAKLSVKLNADRYPVLKSEIPCKYFFRVRALASQVFVYEGGGISIPNKVVH